MNKTLAIILAVLLGGMALLGMAFISYNNSFATMDEQIKGNWAQVENQLKRRADLIPNLVETVKGFASHEKEIFSEIAEARSKLLGAAGNPKASIEANNELSGALTKMLAVSERYPNLKSDATFTRLMDELSGTENRITVERQRYNESVQSFNASLRQIPGGMVGSMMGFRQATYFEVAAQDKAAPKVGF